METHVRDLPDDILYSIFRHMLDGITILKCEKVCVRWRDLIHQLCKYSFWKLTMLKEAGMNTAKELAGCTSLSESCLEENYGGAMCVWKELYVKWQMSIRIHNEPIKSEFDWESGSCQFLPVDICISFITCIIMTETENGLVFVTGHRDGHCILWLENDIKNAKVVLTFDTEVKYIVIVDFKKSNGLCHKHIVAASISGVVKMFCMDNPEMITTINDKTLSGRNEVISTLRIFGRQVFLEFSSNNFMVYQLIREEGEKCQVKVQEKPMSEFQTAVNRVQTSSTDFYSIFWDDKISYLGSYDLFVDVHDVRLENAIRRRVPSKVFCFRNDIILLASNIFRVAILEERYEIAIRDNSKGNLVTAWHDYKNLGNLITAAHIYGGILALGSSTGVLTLFKFKKLKELLELDFGNPLYTLQICRNWISGITITTFNLKQVIVKVVANGYFKIIDLRWNIEI